MYVIVEHLKDYLLSLRRDLGDADQPLYVGRTLRQTRRLVYNTGGPGYVLNRAAIAQLANHLDTPLCFSHAPVSFEDVMVGSCLAELGIHPLNSKDELRRERFHWQEPYVEYTGDSEDYKYFSSPALFNLPVQLGENCCSANSISFHNMKPAMYVQCFHSRIYENCGQEEFN